MRRATRAAPPSQVCFDTPRNDRVSGRGAARVSPDLRDFLPRLAPPTFNFRHARVNRPLKTLSVAEFQTAKIFWTGAV